MSNYEFTTTWFDYVKPMWDHLIPSHKPARLLEIGSFEGASTCHLINMLTKTHDIELHCIDTWDGGIEHKNMQIDMNEVERKFKHNTSLAINSNPFKTALNLHKMTSDVALPKLLSNGCRNYFDFIYVDGSHLAPDVLFDLTTSWLMLKTNGIMIMDDYLWAERLPGGTDPLRTPKPAIDAFVNINIRNLTILPYHLWQLYVQKNA